MTDDGGTYEIHSILIGGVDRGIGYQQRKVIPQPAAGPAFSYTVPPETFERLLALTFTYTADAVVGARSPVLSLTDGGANTLFATSFVGGQAATNATVYSVAPGFPNSEDIAGSYVRLCWADMMLSPGYKINVTMTGGDVADQYSGIVLTVQRFPSDIARRLVRHDLISEIVETQAGEG